jgi:acetyl esterase/lipase
MTRLVASSLALLFVFGTFSRAQDTRREIKVQRDIVFGKGGDAELKLDLAMPADGDGPFPAVVLIHGGAWQAGKRGDLGSTIEVLARGGLVAATIDYRLVPTAAFPGQIEDCKAAVRWLRANAKTYKIDAEHIGAVGFSAGAHLACLLGTTTKDDGLEGKGGNAEQSSRVQAVVSFFGPTDFTTRTWSDELEKKLLVPFVGASFADKPELYKKVSPVSYVRKDAAPHLFFHGTEDKVVAPRHSRTMAEKLKEVGVSAKVVELEGEGHGWKGEKLRQTIEQMNQFLDEQLKPAKKESQ